MRFKFSLLLVVLALVLVVFVAGCRPQTTTTKPRVPPTLTSPEMGPGYASDCLECHGEGTEYYEFPVDHAGRTNDQCLTCHQVKQ